MRKAWIAARTCLWALVAALALGSPAWGATNQVTDPGGGSVSLLGSGNVTVNSSQLQLVKQVWDQSGANCLASTPSDASCNGGATSITVASGTQLSFLIFVRNATDTALSDVRFQDALDVTATGFTYVGTILRTPNDGTAPASNATLAQIVAAAATAQTDAFDGATQVDEFAGYGSNTLKVGNTGVAGENDTLSVPANKTFAVRFQATKK